MRIHPRCTRRAHHPVAGGLVALTMGGITRKVRVKNHESPNFYSMQMNAIKTPASPLTHSKRTARPNRQFYSVQTEGLRDHRAANCRQGDTFSCSHLLRWRI